MNRVAHESAAALVARVKHDPSPRSSTGWSPFTDEHGIDAVAELWARACPHTPAGRPLAHLPHARRHPPGARRGHAASSSAASRRRRTIDPVVAGAPPPATPAEILELADLILRGVFDGDFAVALERGARVLPAGLGRRHERRRRPGRRSAPTAPATLTRRALRLSELGADLVACAALWRDDSLD